MGLALQAANDTIRWEDVFLGVALAGFPTVGALIASRRPENAIGWILAAIGIGAAACLFSREYARYALLTRPGFLPGGAVMAWVSTWVSFLPFLIGATFLLLLYPDGHLPSRRWRPVAWLAGMMLAVSLLSPLSPGELAGFSGLRNPVGIGVLRGVTNLLWLPFFLLTPAVTVACGFSLVVRFRRSEGVERQQLKWFTFMVVMFVVVLPFFVYGSGWFFSLPDVVFYLLLVPPLALAPVAVGSAILKYRLYDIDLIINRTLVYASLTVVLALVYVAGVVGVGESFEKSPASKATTSWSRPQALL